MALFRQLQRMIREEATNGALKTPEEPQLPARGPADKPQLGDKTAARREHEKAAAERAAARLDREDDPELVALDVAYKGKTFYDADCGEYRFIENIEWNEPADRFEAVTVKVYKPGHASAGQQMKRLERWPYGLSVQEQPEMKRMVAAYADGHTRPLAARNAQPQKAKAKAPANARAKTQAHQQPGKGRTLRSGNRNRHGK